jgi:hypothetical protein
VERVAVSAGVAGQGLEEWFPVFGELAPEELEAIDEGLRLFVT